LNVRLASLAIASLLGCLACQPAAVAPAARREQPKDAVLHDATLSTWRANTPVVTARAKTITWFRQDGRFIAGDVDAQLPSRQGPIEVKTPRVEGHVTGEALDASQGVTVRSKRGVATSPSAHVATGPEGTIVSSDAGVVFEGPGQKLTARAFRLDANAQRATFEGVETSTEGAP
jgi:hypothetical protein